MPPAEPDTIEVSTEHAPQIHEDKTGLPADAIEAVFMIRNEHGLHARPSAVLVNEVKKYNASVAVQNLDRDTQCQCKKFDENCGARCRERSSLTFRGER